MRPSEALAKHRDEVLAIIARYPVSNPRVFGSTARGEDTEGSDLDLLVEHSGQASTFDLARLETELEKVLHTRVEIQTPGGLSGKVAIRVAQDLRPI